MLNVSNQASIKDVLTLTLAIRTEAIVDLAASETNLANKASGVETTLLPVHAYRHPIFIEVQTVLIQETGL